MTLKPGERIGLSCGWPALTIVRDADGRYYEERLSPDLKEALRTEISATDAAAWLNESHDDWPIRDDYREPWDRD